ncbi:MAG: sugar phosphate isomerase/epimerase [Armatimonadetes bacterium]|nr:sugar phosphate isomerase/epimerase [Armatimonadota bacterium]
MPANASAGEFRLSIWTSLYWDLSPEDVLRHIADLGWGVIDLSCEHFGELWRSEAPRVDGWRGLAEELGITPWQCHLFMDLNLASADADERADMIGRCAEHLRLAGRLGVRNAVLHPGWLRRGQLSSVDRVRANLTSSLGELAPICRETGVRLAVENMVPPEFGVHPSELVGLAEAVDPAQIGICFDSSHANMSKLPTRETVAACGTHLFCLHLSDNDGSGDQHRVPYEGTADWPGLVAGLREIGYAGPLNFEIPSLSPRPLAVRDAALAYVQRAMHFAAEGGDCCYLRRPDSIRDFCRQGWFDPKFGYE